MQRLPAYARIADRIKTDWVMRPGAHAGAKLPTERQLQATFGVSRATISRAMALLVDEGLVETRQGSGAYLSDACGRPERTRLIGFIAPNIPQPVAGVNPILLRIYCGIENRARELGYQVLAASANFSVAHEEALIERFLRLGAEGVVVYPVYFPEPRRRADATRDHLARRWRDVPMVVTDIGDEVWGRTLVQFDNYRLGYDLAHALVQKGHRKILFMHSPVASLHNSTQDRVRGWEAALLRTQVAIPDAYRGWPHREFGVGETETLAEELADEALRLDPAPDAIVAWDDAVAIALTQALERRGVDVPDAIRVTGFDSHEIGRYFSPSFPTSDPDFARMGELAMELLDQQIRGASGPPRTHLLPASVLWREPRVVRTLPLGGKNREAVAVA